MSAITQLTKLLTELVANTGRIADELAQANRSRRAALTGSATVHNDHSIVRGPAIGARRYA
jgi:hypothetical protein